MYFRYLHGNLSLKTAVKSFLPQFYFSLFAPKLSKEDIENGVYFHLQRKMAKGNYSHLSCMMLRIFYTFKFKLYYRQFYYLLNRLKPKCIAVWNGYLLDEMAAKLVAQKLDIVVWHFENGLLPNTVTLDAKGINNCNSVPRTESFYRSYQPIGDKLPTGDRQLVVRKYNKHKIDHVRRQDFHLSLPKKFIFVPFQVGFDSQVILNSPHIDSMYELYRWIEFIVENIGDESLVFVVKEHPSDPCIYEELYHKNTRILFSNRNTQELIECADAIITVNSSVGLESLMFHKPVIVLGDACYKIEGMTQEASSKEELISVVEGLSDWTVDVPLIEKFLDYLRQDYCIPGSWHQPDINHVKHIESRFLGLVGTRDV